MCVCTGSEVSEVWNSESGDCAIGFGGQGLEGVYVLAARFSCAFLLV